MSIFLPAAVLFLSFLIFLFFFWRNLKEDFESTIIFRSGFVMALGFVIGQLVAVNLLPRLFPSSNIFDSKGLWFWGAFFGTVVGFFVSQRVFKLSFYEALEASVIGFLFATPLITREWLYSVVAILVYYLLKRTYKGFTWYKSGKVGFAGLSSLGVFFLVRSVLALVASPMLVFTGIGKVEVVLCAALAFLSFFAVYNLSEL